MKNIFTGTLAFIVYAGLCLLLYNYLFTDSITAPSLVEEKVEILPVDPVEKEVINVNNDSITIASNNLNAELDSIAAAKEFIDQPLQNIDEEGENNDISTESLNEEDDVEIAAENLTEDEIYEPEAFTVTGENGESLTQCTTFSTIYKNNPKVKIPYNCRSYGNDIKDLIANNPNAQIIINGFYNAEENNDMGLKRAQYVKKLLTNIGINSKQIVLNDTEKNIQFNSGIAQGGIEITVTNLSQRAATTTKSVTTQPTVKEAAPQKTAEKVVTKPKTVVSTDTGPYGYKRFTSGYQADYFYGNASFTSYINQVSNYLDSNNGKKVYVYGYTDTVGNATDNYNIGKENVKTAKRLMVQSGIPSNKIVAVSKGEKSAGVSGSNRGIVIIVK